MKIESQDPASPLIPHHEPDLTENDLEYVTTFCNVWELCLPGLHACVRQSRLDALTDDDVETYLVSCDWCRCCVFLRCADDEARYVANRILTLEGDERKSAIVDYVEASNAVLVGILNDRLDDDERRLVRLRNDFCRRCESLEFSFTPMGHAVSAFIQCAGNIDWERGFSKTSNIVRGVGSVLSVVFFVCLFCERRRNVRLKEECLNEYSTALRERKRIELAIIKHFTNC